MVQVTVNKNQVNIELSKKQAEELMAILGCGTALVGELFTHLYRQGIEGHRKYRVTSVSNWREVNRGPTTNLRVIPRNSES
jgi:hypothetical protein